MPDIGLVHRMLAHAGLCLTMMGSGFLLDTGTATAAGATMTIIGTTTATAIFVNMTGAETTIVTSLHLASGLDAGSFKLLTRRVMTGSSFSGSAQMLSQPRT